MVALNPPGKAQQPEERPRLDRQPAPDGTVWLIHWRGHQFKTKKQVLAARCQECDHGYELRGSSLNELASKMGAWGKFSFIMDGLGPAASALAGHSTSQDAGKQLYHSRMEADAKKAAADFEAAIDGVRCPSCWSFQVLVEAPSDGPAPKTLAQRINTASRSAGATARVRVAGRLEEHRANAQRTNDHGAVSQIVDAAGISGSTNQQAAPAGWYTDPRDPAGLRYWDGAIWTEHTHRAEAPSDGAAPATPAQGIRAEQSGATAPQAAPAGWYTDPRDPAGLRYWDGAIWTEHTHRSN